MSVGLVGSSRKEHELRLPLHPRQIADIAPELRRRLVVERGYGERFQVADSELADLGVSLASRERVIAGTDLVVIPKPMAADVEAMREGQTLCGWVHAVQDTEITQLAIDRKLTAITWESMNFWGEEGSFRVHVFQENNELAGYCSVLHAMQLRGMTGEYGRKLRGAVVGFGATGRGAIAALTALGVHEVTCLTSRPTATVADPIHGVELVTFERDPDDSSQGLELDAPHDTVAELLAEFDVIVNCVLQDTDRPLILVREEELELFAPGTVFVDVSCDEGMGFEWARPTTFADPMFEVGRGRFNYGVDHSPSLLWDAATWEIGTAFAEVLPDLSGGPDAWQRSETVSRAIEIRDGRLLNEKIISFQGRAGEFPHEIQGDQEEA